MVRYDAGTTNPTLLHRLGDWRDHEAWVDFVMRYDPVIRICSRRYRLDAEATEELCQRVWIDLARRMRTYRYDPGKTFRGWLRRLCESRAIDLLRQKRTSAVESLADQPDWSPLDDAADFDGDLEAASERPVLLHRPKQSRRRYGDVSASSRGVSSGTSPSLGSRCARQRQPLAFLITPRSPPSSAWGECSVKRESGFWPIRGGSSQRSDGLATH